MGWFAAGPHLGDHRPKADIYRAKMQDILDAYAGAATPAFIATYDGLSTETIYKHVIDLFPVEASRIVDIGAGTGRDAAWFAERGHEVLVVEPVRELREAGQNLHRSTRIIWLDDRLPDLASTRSHDPFDLVLLGGVWQHLTDDDRTASLPHLAALTAEDGRLVMSLRHGPSVGGRSTFPIDTDATITSAQDCGLKLIRRCDAESIQPGNKAMGVWWTWLAFKKVARCAE